MKVKATALIVIPTLSMVSCTSISVSTKESSPKQVSKEYLGDPYKVTIVDSASVGAGAYKDGVAARVGQTRTVYREVCQQDIETTYEVDIVQTPKISGRGADVLCVGVNAAAAAAFFAGASSSANQNDYSDEESQEDPSDAAVYATMGTSCLVWGAVCGIVAIVKSDKYEKMNKGKTYSKRRFSERDTIQVACPLEDSSSLNAKHTQRDPSSESTTSKATKAVETPLTTLFLPAEDVPPCRHRIPCDVLRVHAFEDRVDGLSKRGHGGRANGLELGLEGVEEVLDRAAFG